MTGTGAKRGCDLIKIKLRIAYDGGAYQGWQTQKVGIGVQQKIEEALQKLLPSKPVLHSSSRTDTGVHALGMVAHFEASKSEFRMDMAKFILALNAWLPRDIRIMSAVRAHPDFHARFDARSKEYRYYIWNGPAMNPLVRHTAWHVPRPLDLVEMRQAAPLFVGKHDFRSFTANQGYARAATERTLFRCEVKRSGQRIVVIMEGDGFLYKMCRGIAGTLVQVGQGKFRAKHIKGMLAQKDRRVAGMTAPAHGLILWKVSYRN